MKNLVTYTKKRKTFGMCPKAYQRKYTEQPCNLSILSLKKKVKFLFLIQGELYEKFIRQTFQVHRNAP